MNKILKIDVLEVVTPHRLSLEIFVYLAKSAVKVTLCGAAAKQLLPLQLEGAVRVITLSFMQYKNHRTPADHVCSYFTQNPMLLWQSAVSVCVSHLHQEWK